MRPLLPPLRTPSAPSRRAIPPRSRALRPRCPIPAAPAHPQRAFSLRHFPKTVRLFAHGAPTPAAPAHPQRVSSPRHFPKVARPSAKANAKSPRLFAFSSPLSAKSPLVLEKSPHVFLPAAPTGSPSAAVAQRTNFTSSGESAQKCARVHFFLLLITFILKKTRYICNENPFYHLCVAKHRDLSSSRCVRRTAYKLPHLARL